MSRPKRKFSYRVSATGEKWPKCKRGFANFKYTKTMSKALRVVASLDYEADIERIFLYGKHKGLAEVFEFRKEDK